MQLELELAELIIASLNLGTKFSLFFFCCVVVAEFKSKKNLSAILVLVVVVVVVVDVPVRALASPDLTNSFTNPAISISEPALMHQRRFASVPETRVSIFPNRLFPISSALGEEGEEGEPPGLEGKEAADFGRHGNDAASTPRRGGAGDKRERERQQERTS